MHANVEQMRLAHNKYGETTRRPTRRELMDDFFDSLEERIQADMADERDLQFALPTIEELGDASFMA